jgi:hypothetical protein
MGKFGPKRRYELKRSMKESTKKKAKKVSGKDNIGILMRKYKDVEDLLYTKTSNLDVVFEDMDFSVEEFSDITGCDLDELLAELEQIVSVF